MTAKPFRTHRQWWVKARFRTTFKMPSKRPFRRGRDSIIRNKRGRSLPTRCSVRTMRKQTTQSVLRTSHSTTCFWFPNPKMSQKGGLAENLTTIRLRSRGSTTYLRGPSSTHALSFIKTWRPTKLSRTVPKERRMEEMPPKPMVVPPREDSERRTKTLKMTMRACWPGLLFSHLAFQLTILTLSETTS